jgi:hypothetical protein
MANATTTETTTNPTSEEEVTPPQFSMPLEELLRSSIFDSIEQVRAWVALYIGAIFKFQPAIEAITNQVNASSAELQARGTRTIKRNLMAQATFLQAKDAFWAARGKKGIEQLQSFLAEMRLDDATDEEFEAACERFLYEYSVIEAELDEKNHDVVRIQNLLDEEMFRDRVLDGSGLQAWQRKLIQEVLRGNGAKQNGKSLFVAANALQREYDKFFGLGRYSATAGKPNGPKKGRSAEKREADRQVTLARKGKKG